MTVTDLNDIVFKNEHERLSLNLFFTFGWINSIYIDQLKEFDLTVHQYHILRALKHHFPDYTPVYDLKQCVPDKKSDVSRLVERLRVKGLVNRVSCPNDRRKAHVILTDEGKKLIDKIAKEDINWLKEATNLSKKDAARLNELLDKLKG